MANNWWQVETSEGAKKIQQYCQDEAKNLGLDLERMSWSTDLVSQNEKYILTIIAKTGTTEITFSREEIEDYASGRGLQKTSEKIRRTLEDVL